MKIDISVERMLAKYQINRLLVFGYCLFFRSQIYGRGVNYSRLLNIYFLKTLPLHEKSINSGKTRSHLCPW